LRTRSINHRLAAVVLAVALVFGVSALTWYMPGRVSAVSAEPGSQEDPLISKSYFDRFVSLQVVTVPAGKTLSCEAGTEIVLRAGKATAIGSDLGGLSDITSGKDVQTGQAIVSNHLLIVPRSDGRGLRAATECVVMVRGAHAISP